MNAHVRFACLLVHVVSLLACRDEPTCSVREASDGRAVLSCSDGTFVTLDDRLPCKDADGGACSETDGGTDLARFGCTARATSEGDVIIACADGSSVVLVRGHDKAGCVYTTLDGGLMAIACPGSDRVMFPTGSGCRVLPLDGGARLACDDGTEVHLPNTPSCTIITADAGASMLTCSDGTSVALPSQSCEPHSRRCRGDEVQICNANGVGYTTRKRCSQGTCVSPGGHCSAEGELRLAAEVRAGIGRIELLYNRAWGTVCGDGFGAEEAHVACRQMGYTTGIRFAGGASSGSGPIWLDELACEGFEPRLLDCRANDVGDHDCTHGADVTVMCGFGGP